MFRYIVLGLLRDGSPRHGYALMKAYRVRTGIQMSTGNFYRELQRMAAAGLVAPAANPPGADPRRVPYEITEAGAEAFDTWLSSPPLVSDYQDEFSNRAVFLERLDLQDATRILDGWRDELWLQSKVIERARQAALRNLSDNLSDTGILPILQARRLQHIGTDVEFVEDLRRRFEEKGQLRCTSSQTASSPAGRRKGRLRS